MNGITFTFIQNTAMTDLDRNMKYIFLSLCVISTAWSQDPSPVVDTKYGPVQGTTIPLHDGKNVQSFLSIRFAKAPVNELRFMVST